jgi:hypothetical protein
VTSVKGYQGNVPAEWTVPQDEELRNLREGGMSIMQIAVKLLRSEGVVRRRLRFLGIKAPPPPPKPPKPEKLAVEIKPPPPKAGPVTLDPLPSLQEPMYVIPVRVTAADLREPRPQRRGRASPRRSGTGSDRPHQARCAPC